MIIIFILILLSSLFLVNINSLESNNNNNDNPCQWTSKTGSSFNVQALTIISQDDLSYLIKDGDIPCTPEVEPTYSYLWNFCADVTKASYPLDICDPKIQIGAAIQYLNRSDGYKECNVIGKYDANKDDTHFSLLDEKDPSKGLSINYASGDKCPTGQLRSATIDITCDNVKKIILSALEPTKCAYHMTMKSYYGCPTECPITSNGLCNSHGHCSYDKINKKPYCYCNYGWYGPSCSDIKAAHTYNGLSVQIGLLIVLLIIAIVLVAIVGYMVHKIIEYRREKLIYSQLTTHSSMHDGDIQMENF